MRFSWTNDRRPADRREHGTGDPLPVASDSKPARVRALESRFEARWDAAGADPGLRTAIARAAARKPPLHRSRSAAWRRLEERMRTGAQKKARVSPIWVTAAAAALGLGVAWGALDPWFSRDAIRERASAGEPQALAAGVLVGGPGRGALTRADSGEWVLERESVEVEVEPRPPGAPPLIFRAGDLRIEVVGTLFALGVEGGQGVIRVYEGAVLARRDDRAAARVESTSGTYPPDRAFAPAAGAAHERWGATAAAKRLASRHPAGEGGAPTAPVPPDVAPQRAPPADAIDEAPPPPPPAPPARTRPSRHRTPRPPRHAYALEARPLGALGAALPGQAPAKATGAAPAKATAKAKGAAPAKATAGSEREVGPKDAVEPSSGRGSPKPRDGASDLAAGGGPSARRQLEDYRAAHELLRAGHPAEAARAFRRMLALYPGGVLADEVQLSLLEALRRAGSSDLAAEAAQWLRLHPDDPRAPEIRKLAHSGESR